MSKSTAQKSLEPRLSPEEAITWLSKPHVIAALGAKIANRMRRHHSKVIANAYATGVTATRIDAARNGGESVYVPGMKLSRGLVRVGNSRPTRRWTPPNNVDQEDFYDLMTPGQAADCRHPSSATGYQWDMVRICELRVEWQQTRLARPRSNARF